MKITEEQRKLLTEWLGECWHEWRFAPEDVTPCLKCRSRKDNRTFDNWEDFGAVVEKLRTTPKEEIDYLTHQCFILEFVESGAIKDSVYEMWLLYPERFCILVAEAIKEGVIK